MIRLFHVHIPGRTLLLAASEACLIALSVALAHYAGIGRDAGLVLVYENGMLKAAVLAAVFIISMHYCDLYDSRVLHSAGQALTRLPQALGTSCLILSLLYYAFPPVQLTHNVFLFAIAVAAVLLGGWRKAFAASIRSPRLSQPALLLGDGPLAGELIHQIECRPELGLHVAGYLDQASGDAGPWNGLRCFGQFENLPAAIKATHANRVILTLGERRGRLPVERLLRLKTKGVVVEDAADVYEAITGRMPLNALRLSSLLFSPGFGASRSMLFYKRAASVALAVPGLLLALPLMALIALIIRLDSAGPVIFRQQRVGRDGARFVLYKFRSMLHGADADKPARENDERCTRVGRWLRRTRLDELPQIYNVLRGDMYLVGPRPFTPKMEEEYERAIPYYASRWSIKPGVTGWAQIHRGYCSTLEDNIEKLSYDLFYVKNLSIGLDCLILLQTCKILLLGRGAR